MGIGGSVFSILTQFLSNRSQSTARWMVVRVNWLKLYQECRRAVFLGPLMFLKYPISFFPFWKISWSVMLMTPLWWLLCHPRCLSYTVERLKCCDWSLHKSIGVNFSKLTDSNQIFKIDFLCIHYHLREISSQIIECKIFGPYELSITNYSMVELTHWVCFLFFWRELLLFWLPVLVWCFGGSFIWVVSRLAGDRPMSPQFRKVHRPPLFPITDQLP